MGSELYVLFVPQDFQCLEPKLNFSMTHYRSVTVCNPAKETKADLEKLIAETEEDMRSNAALLPDRNPMK